jgi:hypothetical protein
MKRYSQEFFLEFNENPADTAIPKEHSDIEDPNAESHTMTLLNDGAISSARRLYAGQGDASAPTTDAAGVIPSSCLHRVEKDDDDLPAGFHPGDAILLTFSHSGCQIRGMFHHWYEDKNGKNIGIDIEGRVYSWPLEYVTVTKG